MECKVRQQIIKDLGPWYQTIDFNGILTNKNHPTGTAEQVYQDIKSFLPKHLMVTNILDIGCSAAYFIIRLMMDGAGEATGIDINPKSIQQAEFTKDFYLKDIKQDIKLLCDDYMDYLRKDLNRYDAIIASSVLYPRFMKSKMDKEWMIDNYYEKAELLTSKTFTIIARWRQENNYRNGDLFYEQLQKFNFHETGRKELCSRTLVRYQRDGNLILSKNHDMVFNDDKPRGWDEIISAVSDCKNLRVWFRLDKDKRKDLSPFITWVNPDILIHRKFNSPKAQKIYNTKTQLEFLENHRALLLKSVKENGIETPIVARETDEGLIVDDGNHRSGIAQSLKLDKIAVIILKEV